MHTLEVSRGRRVEAGLSMCSWSARIIGAASGWCACMCACVCARMSSPFHLLQLHNTRKHRRDADLLRDKNKTIQKRTCLHLFGSTIPTCSERNVILCISNQFACLMAATGGATEKESKATPESEKTRSDAKRRSREQLIFYFH